MRRDATMQAKKPIRPTQESIYYVDDVVRISHRRTVYSYLNQISNSTVQIR